MPALLAILPLSVVGLMTIGDLRAFRLNPVMVKELRGRMRGVRGFAIITVFLTLMSFFTMLLYLLRVPQGGVVVTGELGRLLFIGVLFIELMLIIFIVPALTAGAITSERERKTYDLLQTTLITKATFVVGKMQSALGYIVLLLLSAIPLQSIAFLFGGVSESELILALLVLTVSAVTLGAFGMFFSSITERTLAATIRFLHRGPSPSRLACPCWRLSCSRALMARSLTISPPRSASTQLLKRRRSMPI